jgi:hypothetical protein
MLVYDVSYCRVAEPVSRRKVVVVAPTALPSFN